MEAKLAIARRWRMIGLALAGLAVVALLASVALNESAVQGEGAGVVSHDGSNVLGVAAVLALVTCALSVRAARGVERTGIAWPVALAFLTAGAAVFGAFVAAAVPIFVNVASGTCLADATGGTGVRPEIAAVATPGACGYQIPTSDYPLFYQAALVALAAAGLVLLGATAMILGRTPPKLAAEG